jgi:hypothetical protein
MQSNGLLENVMVIKLIIICDIILKGIEELPIKMTGS